MRFFYIFYLLCFLPLPAPAAVQLASCDDKPHDVIVRNGGAERVVTLTKKNGEIEEFGPVVSFQIKDSSKKQPIITATTPDEEFCIWGNKIEVQRLNTSAGMSDGTGWR